jgi:hypothetical protein
LMLKRRRCVVAIHSPFSNNKAAPSRNPTPFPD